MAEGVRCAEPAHSRQGSNVSDKSPKKDSAKKIKQADKAAKNA